MIDLVFTICTSGALVALAAVTLSLLPWSDAQRAGTVRGMRAVVRWAICRNSQVPR